MSIPPLRSLGRHPLCLAADMPFLSVLLHPVLIKMRSSLFLCAHWVLHQWDALCYLVFTTVVIERLAKT